MLLADCNQVFLDAVEPSDLGPVFTEYRNDPEGAIRRLLVERTGDARAVWSRPEIGPIDLIWGGDRFGLKKIAKKHPEALEKIPHLLKHGRLIWGEGGGKVFLVDDGNPVHITVISLSYLGVAKAWILTSYDDTKGRASGILASVDTKKLDSAEMGCRSTVPMLEKILGHDMEGVNIFDDATRLGALERLKLIKRLRELRIEADGLGSGGAAAMRKLKIAKEMIEIRQKLGLGAPQPAPAPNPEPVAAPAPALPPEQSENEHVKTLRNIAKGLHDGDGLDGMFGLIQEAVNSLEEDGALTTEAEQVANEAITHWAEVEERLNG